MSTPYLLRTTRSNTAVITLEPGEDPWLAGVRYVRETYSWDLATFLDDIRPASPQDLAANGITTRGDGSTAALNY